MIWKLCEDPLCRALGFLFFPTALPEIWADSRQLLLFPLDKVSSVRTFYIVYNKNRILKSHVKQFIHFTEGFYQNPETP